MSQTTAIGWTDVSWNPVHGCSIVSTECRNCYAQTLSLRYRQTLLPWTRANAGQNVLLKPHKLSEPLRDTKDYRGLGAAAARAGKTDGQLVFVNSMSDLFHEEVPVEFIADVFAVMAVARRHTFQVLTKRAERMAALLGPHGPLAELVAERLAAKGEQLDAWPLPNVWLGVSIGLRHFVRRADLLRQTPAAVRFISAEPLLGPLEGLWLEQIDWLIVGGESGPDHRLIRAEWVRDLRDFAWLHDTAFFFKQWGGRTPQSGGRELDGRTWDEFPAPARAAA